MKYLIPTNAGKILIENVPFSIDGGNLSPKLKLIPSKGYLLTKLIFKLDNVLEDGTVQVIEFSHETGPIFFEQAKFNPANLLEQILTYLSQFIVE